MPATKDILNVIRQQVPAEGVGLPLKTAPQNVGQILDIIRQQPKTTEAAKPIVPVTVEKPKGFFQTIKEKIFPPTSWI
ncbi:MAG: hypothetical protein COS88_06530, partial [Chloroflexi bacterium CG07_land_8_20_14_0_80_51_10]